MALPISFNPNQPTPNNPFYSPETYIVLGIYNPLIVGAGLTVDSDGVISSTGGGGGVNTIIAGAGISVSGPSGNVTVSNTGVTNLIAGSGISLSAGTGSITVSATGVGTVTSISTGAGLTGGPITTSGTIALTNTGVTAGTYTNASIAVDAQGRITSVSSGTAVGSVLGTSPINVSTVAGTSTVSINAASTTQAGAVQLSDSVTNISVTQAATANAVKTAFDAAVAAIPKACITGKGGLVTGTGASIPAPLPVGLDGQVLTADSTSATGLKWGATAASTPQATPILLGTVYACTQNDNVALGCNAALSNLGSLNTALGCSALKAGTGSCSAALGANALCALVSGNGNVAVGACSLIGATTGACNIGLGFNALSTVTTGSSNVAIGPNVQVPSATGSCQLAIGYGLGNFWLTGNSTKAIQPGAGIIDCTASCGTTNMVLTSQGNAIQWKSVNSSIASPNFGSYLNTTTQIINTVNVPQAVTLNTTIASNGFTLNGGNTQITAVNAGTYNLQFSLQLVVASGGGGNVEVWLAKNGNPVPNSNTRFAVKNVNEAEFAALNYVDTLAAGDYLQLIWVTDDIHIQLVSYAAGANFAGAPAIPSAIVTIVPVGA